MSEKLYSIYSTDSYFCTNCNQGWKDNKWMMCCTGCVGHKNMGWTIPEMSHVYGTAMDAMARQGRKDTRYYFPVVKRKKCSRRLSFSPFRNKVGKNILQGFSSYALDWRLQQGLALKDYTHHPCKTTWDRIDPEVQRLVVYKGDLRM